MSKKGKGVVVLDSTTPYRVGVYEDAKARMKYQTLMQDYQELQKEVDVMRSNLQAGKQRKIILAAEVRFLRRRYEYFVKTETMNSSQKQKLVQAPNLLKQTKHMKDLSRKVPEPKLKKKHCIGNGAMQNGSTVLSDLNHNGRIATGKKTSAWNAAPAFDLNQKERMHVNDTSLRNTIVPLDLNQDDNPSGKETSLPNRAHVFDLNEISTGEEDFQSNAEALKFEEVKKSSMRGPTNEAQNELKLSIFRNAGEGPSRVGKRKISWQDPVALRV
ncbi:hypothetical protein CDL12_19186 [Handroanthus impetiginosus]|uniref:Uncharacterized protein n=1 Tax=Handroanthus impetiginosus TaxID=429701 RepID=A0A2G9GSG5_9LAMI|nr:hypothetical protein CDL12_19186 [Handroanthus impetiginosus]